MANSSNFITILERKLVNLGEVEKAALERKVGQLTIEIDWLKKKLGIQQ